MFLDRDSQPGVRVIILGGARSEVYIVGGGKSEAGAKVPGWCGGLTPLTDKIAQFTGQMNLFAGQY